MDLIKFTLLRPANTRRLVFQCGEISLLATRNETFRHRFQFFPARADLFGFLGRDLIVRRSHGDDGEQVSKFLDDLVGGRDEIFRVRLVGLGIQDEETTGAFADPLHEATVVGAAYQLLDAIQRIDRAAAVAIVRLGPFVDHGEREVEVGGNLLRAGFLDDLAQEFVRLHGRTM